MKVSAPKEQSEKNGVANLHGGHNPAVRTGHDYPINKSEMTDGTSVILLERMRRR